MKNYEAMNYTELIDEVLREVHYDAHNTSSSYRRSGAKQTFLNRLQSESQLGRRGCFMAVEDVLKTIFNSHTATTEELFHREPRRTEGMFYLLFDVTRTVGEKPPYSEEAKFGTQSFEVWAGHFQRLASSN